ncbi:MAG: hypothetical protein RJA70_3305 [Pseudomonadota bacterium]
MGEAEGLSVLVVDDSAVARSKLGELCERVPFVTVVGYAADGAEAIRKARQTRPDLVLLDLVMPNIDGLTALRMLCGGVKDIRVAVVSSLGGSTRVAEEAFRFGAIEVLSKPVQAQDVDRLCRKELGHKVSSRGEPAEATRPASRPIGIKFFGQFLLERGELTLEQLRSALHLIDRSVGSLEEVAVEQGLLEHEQVAELKAEGRRTGYSIRELIEQDNLLNESAINQLLMARATRQLSLAQALSDLRFLPQAKLDALLSEYDEERASTIAGPGALPAPLSSHRPTHVMLDLIPAYLHRVAGVTSTVNYARDQQAPAEGAFRVGLTVRGSSPIRVEFVADRELATRLVIGLTKRHDEYSDRSLSDGMLEFLNIVTGNTLTILESEGLHLAIEAESGNHASDRGTCVELVASAGRAWICLDANPDLPDRSSQLDLQLDTDR